MSMENTLEPVDKKVVYQPELDFGIPNTYFIQKGSNDATYQQVSTTNYSNSQITFNVIPPSVNTIIDRYHLIKVQFSVTIQGNAPADGTNLVQLGSGLNAPRSFPLSQCISSFSATLNNQSFSATISEYISALAWALELKNQSLYGSCYPSTLDNCQDYKDNYPSNSNPLNSWDSSSYCQYGRGAFPITVIAGPTGSLTTSAIVTFTTLEPIMMAPYLFSTNQKEKGFSYIQQYQLQMNLGNLNRVWSSNQVQGNPFTSLSVNISAPPVLLIKYYTKDIVEEIPRNILYPFETLLLNKTGPFVIAPNAQNQTQFQMVSNSLNLNQIPSKIYIFARRQTSDLQSINGYQYADGFALIKNVSITFNNKAGLLSSASPEDLWRMSVKNGVNISWPQWNINGVIPNTLNTANIASPIVGSVLCIKPVEDFGLPSNLSAGVYGKQFNFQLTVSALNPSLTSTVSYELCILTCSDGILTLSQGGSSFLQQGTLTETDVLTSHTLERVPMHQVQSPYGGSFFSDIKNFASKASDFLKKHKIISGVASAIPHPIAQGIASAAQSLGYGALPKKQLKKQLKERMRDLEFY